MIVDTSIWVDHFRRGEPRLSRELETGGVLMHPFVIGELACGQLRHRQEILDLLDGLPVAALANHEEALLLVDSEHLYGRGIGWIDVHLLASAHLSGVPIWTRDRRLKDAATSLGVSL